MIASKNAKPSADRAHNATQALSDMLDSQAAAMGVVRGALNAIAAGAALMATAVKRNARLHYAAAGSSGLMALADASELPGTFGIDQSSIRVHMAGGVPVEGVMPGDTEDSAEDAVMAAAAMEPGDLAIVVSASGSTPYATAFARAARARDCAVIALANVTGSELLDLADVAIALPTAPEFVDGSTRLGAGTAQKVALNMMSTQMGILLGHVHDGMMVNLNPDNIKLRKRAANIVCRISNVERPVAIKALELTGYNTKAATLVALGCSAGEALDLLERHDGFLDASLARIASKNDTQN